jgi:hypothetical protein
MIVGKLINFFVVKPTKIEEKSEIVKQEIVADIEPENNESEEKIANEPSGWESEAISFDPSIPSLEIPSSNATTKAMKRQFKRKCISVGPIMLTPTSQVIRTLNAEEREERYRYFVSDIPSPDLTLDNPKETTTADNVCVPLNNYLID